LTQHSRHTAPNNRPNFFRNAAADIIAGSNATTSAAATNSFNATNCLLTSMNSNSVEIVSTARSWPTAT